MSLKERRYVIRNRPSRKRRRLKRTVLVVTNGVLTETDYLKNLRREIDDPDINIKIEPINADPKELLKKLSSPIGDTSGYDEVWFVIDEDGVDRQDFLNQCKKHKAHNQQWIAIISRPCFEVWLIAHYEQVRNYANQQEAQRHYRQLIPATTGRKGLPPDFPYGEFDLATTQCQLPGTRLAGLNQLPPYPGTSMPHLIEALGLKRKATKNG